MRFKIVKNTVFIVCISFCFLFVTPFYNFISGFSTISTIKTKRYNTRRAQYYEMLESKPEPFIHKTEDNIGISGWVMDRPESDSILLICHGYKQSKEHLSVLANLFNEYTVVLFDLRAHGDSDGSLVSFGYHEYKDVHAVLNFIKKDLRFSKKKLYGLGISMGAASIANAASKGAKFDGLILDSCFSTIDFDVVTKFISIPKLFFYFGKYLFRLISGVDIDKIKPGVFLSTIDCPVMIMHSKSDEKMDVFHAKELYEKVLCKNKSLVLCEGSHGLLFRHDSDFYKKTVTNFLSKI